MTQQYPSLLITASVFSFTILLPSSSSTILFPSSSSSILLSSSSSSFSTILFPSFSTILVHSSFSTILFPSSSTNFYPSSSTSTSTTIDLSNLYFNRLCKLMSVFKTSCCRLAPSRLLRLILLCPVFC